MQEGAGPLLFVGALLTGLGCSSTPLTPNHLDGAATSTLDSGARVDTGAGVDRRGPAADAAAAGLDSGDRPDAGGPGPDAGSSHDGGLPPCPTFAAGVELGRTPLAAGTESSGLVESRRNPGVLWLHNDSGDTARVFAVSTRGSLLSTCTLEGASARDWEDLALGPGPVAGTSYLYLGDIGDNNSVRDDVDVYRVAEPQVGSGTPALLTLAGVERLTLVYPDRAHNAETLLVDPQTGDLFIVVKAGSGTSPVYRAAAPLAPGSPITLERVASLDFGSGELPGDSTTTGGDISPSGDAIAIRTYDSAFVWRRTAGASIAATLATAPCPVPVQAEGQGEALGFAADGSGYYTVSEGSAQPIFFYARQ